MAKCMECCETKAKHEDPSDAPLDFGIVLCDDCWCAHAQDVIERAQDEIDDIKEQAKEKKLDLLN